MIAICVLTHHDIDCTAETIFWYSLVLECNERLFFRHESSINNTLYRFSVMGWLLKNGCSRMPAMYEVSHLYDFKNHPLIFVKMCFLFEAILIISF